MFLLNPGNLWAFIRVHYGVKMNILKYNYFASIFIAIMASIYLYISDIKINIYNFFNIQIIIGIFSLIGIILFISMAIFAFKFYRAGYLGKHLSGRIKEKDENDIFGEGEYSRGANLFISYFSLYTIIIFILINIILNILYTNQSGFLIDNLINFTFILTLIYSIYLAYFLLKSITINIYNWFLPIK